MFRPPYPEETTPRCPCGCEDPKTEPDCPSGGDPVAPDEAPVGISDQERDARQKKPLTYLACPYSHDSLEVKQWRFEEATKAASWLIKEYGWNVFSPITHSHPLHTFGGCSGDWKYWAKIDREYLEASERMVVLLVSGWRLSTGVTAELAIAGELGIPVSYIIPSKWVPGQYVWIQHPLIVEPHSIPLAEPPVCSAAPDKSNPKDLVGETKPQLHLVPPAALIYMAKVMELGAKKYGPYNWRSNKVRHTVYLSAALRHLLTALDGESIDPESGSLHVAHAAACMAIIMDAKATGNLIDDLPIPGKAAELIKQLTVKKAL